MLYFLYFILLIFHCPDFWKVLLCPAIIWSGEVVYRLLHSFVGHGQTQISAGVLLPSRVTNLIIKRPEGFKFSPGDWVFIKVFIICTHDIYIEGNNKYCIEKTLYNCSIKHKQKKPEDIQVISWGTASKLFFLKSKIQLTWKNITICGEESLHNIYVAHWLVHMC